MAWINYRDLVCQYEASEFEGGSIANMILSNCLERVTTQRLADLKQYLKATEL